MIFHPLKSDLIESYSWTPNEDRQSGILALRFKGGRAYWYRNVPTDELASFLMAQSHGTYARRFIVGRYVTVEVDGDDNVIRSLGGSQPA